MLFAGFVVHPLIRLLSFIIFAAFVSLGQTMSSILGMVILVVVYALSCQLPAPVAWRMIKRLRIFFVSIFIMYLWFTPGELLFPGFVSWSPTFEGLWYGIQRILALVIMVLGVECLLRLTDRTALLCGLYYIAYPFKWLGVDRNRFIIRILLTLEAVDSTGMPGEKMAFKLKHAKKYFSAVSIQMVNKFQLAAANSDGRQPTDFQPIDFELEKLPHWLQWLIPITISVIFLIATGVH